MSRDRLNLRRMIHEKLELEASLWNLREENESLRKKIIDMRLRMVTASVHLERIVYASTDVYATILKQAIAMLKGGR